MSSLRTRYYVTSSACGPLLFKMSTWKLQTLKEWNKNSPNLVYCHLVPAWFDVLWFEMDPAVFTQLTVPVCYICHHFVMDKIKVQSLPKCQSKICQMPLLEQSAKYSSRQNSGHTVCCCVEIVVFYFSCQLYKHIAVVCIHKNGCICRSGLRFYFAKMSRMDLKLIDSNKSEWTLLHMLKYVPRGNLGNKHTACAGTLCENWRFCRSGV